MTLTVTFANVNGGFLFTGKRYGDLALGAHSIRHYVKALGGQQKADVLCLSEVHLESIYQSAMVKEFARQLGYKHFAAAALDDKLPSHLDKTKLLGMGILSRYPIESKSRFVIKAPEPRLKIAKYNETTKQNDVWELFDKGGLRVRLQAPDGFIDVVNSSFFPFHHFKRKMNEPAFKEVRQQLVRQLDKSGETRLIVTCDFNNKDFLLHQGFPELFTNSGFIQAVTAPTTVLGHNAQQLDHILVKPTQFEVESQLVWDIGSDHYATTTSLTQL